MPDFLQEYGARMGRVFAGSPDAYDHRGQHPWLLSSLGDVHADVWFVAENPSLTQVERARSPDGGPATVEAQWWASRGDQLFRRMLVAHGFKTGEIDSPGGWRCYITNVIKETEYAGKWRSSGKERIREALDRWKPLFEWEIEYGNPRLVVALGDTVRRHLDYLAARGVRLPEIVTIRHYSYVAMRPEGRKGPMHPDRVAAYDAQFASIAARFSPRGHHHHRLDDPPVESPPASAVASPHLPRDSAAEANAPAITRGATAAPVAPPQPSEGLGQGAAARWPRISWLWRKFRRMA
jgi:hypothetical protein